MTTETKSLAELASEVKSLVDEKTSKLQEIAEKALAEAEKGIGMSETTKGLVDQIAIDRNELKGRLDELEQKMARPGSFDAEAPRTAGHMLVEDENVKSFLANPTSGQRVGVETKAIISALATDANGSAGDLLTPQRVDLLPILRRELTVRDLLTPGRTNTNAIQYPKQTGFTNSAATVSETTGATKPQSEIKFDIVTTSVTTIAHFVIATRQILDDAPALQSYIDGEMRAGLAEVEENQLLNGGGTGTDLNGIYTQATPFAAGTAIVSAPTRLDAIRFAMLQGELAFLPPTGIVMHSTDWALIESTKDAAGGYIIGNPQDGTSPRLWGLPVVKSLAMTAGTFLTGAFRRGAQIFDRWDARVEISTEDSTNFRQNLITILAEERLALAVYRPEAFVKGTFSAAITDLTS
jgi:HK97 family phage major capsid protein